MAIVVKQNSSPGSLKEMIVQSLLHKFQEAAAEADKSVPHKHKARTPEWYSSKGYSDQVR